MAGFLLVVLSVPAGTSRVRFFLPEGSRIRTAGRPCGGSWQTAPWPPRIGAPRSRRLGKLPFAEMGVAQNQTGGANRRSWSMLPLSKIPFWCRIFEPQPNEKLLMKIPFLALKGIDFTTGHVFLFLLFPRG